MIPGSSVRPGKEARLTRLFMMTNKKLSGLVAAFLLLGVVLRLTWALLYPPEGLGEAGNVAIALATGRGFADAYGAGQGPTAHLMPVSPAIASLFYRALGLNTLPSRMGLAIWSIGLSMGSYIFFNRAFSKLGVDQWARACALIFMCVVPLYIGQESQIFGVWEGGLAALLSSITLSRLTDRTASKTPYFAATIGGLCAITFFVNPILGVALGASAIFAMLGTWSVNAYRSFLVSGAIFLSVLLIPWIARNDMVLGTPILTRSNSGLELALGTNPEMLSGKPRDVAFKDRMQELHPAASQAAFVRMQRVGEVEYSRRLGSQAMSWIRAHPQQEAELLLLHLRSMLAPQPWMFRMLGNPRAAEPRSLIESAIGILGLMGLAFGRLTRGRLWSSVGMMVIVSAVLFTPFQSTHRYNYVFYAPFVFSATFLATAVLRSIRLRTLTGPNAAEPAYRADHIS